MTDRPPPGTDEPEDDRSGDGLRLRFELNLLRGERVRAALLAGFFAVLAAFLAARFVVALVGTPDGGAADGARIGTPIAVVVAFLGFELLIRRFLGQRLAAREPIPPALWYLTTFAEMAFLTAVLYLPLRLGADMGARAVGFEGQVVVLLLFIGLSVTRLRFVITAFTGLLAATAYLLIVHLIGSGLAEGAAASYVGTFPEGHLWVAGLIAGSGLVAGYLAGLLRQQTLGLVRSLAERQRLEHEVTRIGDQERHRIGRDLHDGLGSHLTGIAMLCRGLVRRVGKGEAVREQEMEAVAAGVEDGVEQARRLARGLSPVDLSDRDLAHALGELVARTEASSGLACTLDVRGPVRARTERMDLGTVTHCYRIAQEAINNAAKHAEAAHVVLTLAAEDGQLLLAVEDDGRGLSGAASTDGRSAEGLGLRTMRYRTDLIGADLTIEDAPGGGTRVRCVYPMSNV